MAQIFINTLQFIRLYAFQSFFLYAIRIFSNLKVVISKKLENIYLLNLTSNMAVIILKNLNHYFLYYLFFLQNNLFF